jgi:hypothetical protein
MVKSPRIKVPAEAVRTAEQILDGQTIVGDSVWLPCWNCGGTTMYPSSMTPPGRCRFYCWENRTPETYGKRPVSVDVYVKREQAADRSEYRARIRFELERPEREAREAAEAVARAEREARAAIAAAEDEAYLEDRRRVSQWVGSAGERIERAVRVYDVKRFESRFGDRYLVRMRDESGNVLIWWTSALTPRVGESFNARATVKAHSSYDGENQTEVLRVSGRAS